jgi:hypothetical protein
MRQIITALSLICLFCAITNSYGQKKTFKTYNNQAFGFSEAKTTLQRGTPQIVKTKDGEFLINPPQVVCYASGETGTNRVPPPSFMRNGNARTEATANIEVTYSSNFPNNARNAFEFAVAIWERTISSPVTIRVSANWEDLSMPSAGSGPVDSRILGAASPATFFRNDLFPRARASAWYPIALAEKIAGRDLNPTNQPDIVASFNRRVTNWFFGTGGNPAPNQLDFVSVILHEIGHGLGFSAYLDVAQNGNGQISINGFNNVPSIYATFIANEAGSFLTDTTAFRRPSRQLGRELVSDALYFESSFAKSRNNNRRIKLYAPTTFEDGSSISHLDNTTYRNSPDALMTPFSNNGESIQDPGNITKNMFAEMGWVLTQIRHTPVPNTDNISSPTNITANIVSDTTINLRNFRMEMRFSDNNFMTETVVPMTLDARNNFNAQIPAANGTKNYRYYFIARNSTNGVEIRLPSSAPRIPFGFTVTTDNDPPVITHTSEGFLLDNTDTTFLVAKVTDVLGVDTVFAQYQIDNGTVQTLPMLFLGTDFNGEVYGNILITRGLIRSGGTLRYRIVSRDISSRNNQGAIPSATDFFTLNIVPIGQARPSYENNFNQMSNTDFATNYFRIEQPTGFADGSLNTAHPYRNGQGPNDESDFVALLTSPITVREREATIRFDEVVLVEPGENGSVFGDGDFYDYVIVEGSSDRGKTWRALVDGYDSRANNIWINAYNQGVVSGNSGTAGTPTLVRPRTINLLERFSPNEQVLLRFRMYADQSAFGWGWLIDNLQIQNSVVGLADYLVYDGDLKVYPNPNQGTFNLHLSNTKYGDVNVRVYNVLGSEIKNFNFNKTDQTFQTELNIGNVPKGLYFLHIKTKEGEAQKKIIID